MDAIVGETHAEDAAGHRADGGLRPRLRLVPPRHELQHLAGAERLHDADRRGQRPQEPRGPVRPGQVLRQRRLVEDQGLRARASGRSTSTSRGARRRASSSRAPSTRQLAAAIKAGLEAYVDPETGEQPVAHVFTRDEAYGIYDPVLIPDLIPSQQRGLPRRLAGQPGRHRQGRSSSPTPTYLERRPLLGLPAAGRGHPVQQRPARRRRVSPHGRHRAHHPRPLRRPAGDQARRPQPLGQGDAGGGALIGRRPGWSPGVDLWSVGQDATQPVAQST